jgi:hypothetical protein
VARSPNQFVDPANRLAPFVWPINHNEEQAVNKSRQMSDGASTDNVGLIPQQGAPTPMVLQWKGSILTKAHLDAMLQWWELCETQTIYVQDFSSAIYEVLITDFDPQRVAVVRNPRDPANAPTWYWTYTLTMRVLQVLSGDWLGVS